MTKTLKWIIIVAVLGSMGAAIVYYSVNKEVADISKKSSDVNFELETMLSEFQANPDDFDSKHMNKILSFKATIINLNAQANGGGTARLQSPFPNIDLNIQLDDRINYEHIWEGDELDFKGVYIGHQEDILGDGFYEMVFQRGYFEKEKN